MIEPYDGTHLDGPCGDHLCPFCRVWSMPPDPNPFPMFDLFPLDLLRRAVLAVFVLVDVGFALYDAATDRWAYVILHLVLLAVVAAAARPRWVTSQGGGAGPPRVA